MIELEVVNHVDCQVHGTAAEKKIVRGLLGYKGVHFHKTQYAMKRTTYTKSMMLKNGVFPTGLLSRLRNSLDRQGISYEVITHEEFGHLPTNGNGHVSDIVLREDQERLVKSTIDAQRGVIVSPTGTGKTLLFLHIMAHFPDTRILILVHNKTILSQTLRELGRFRQFAGACKLGDGERVLAGKVVVATRQSMVTREMRNVGGRVVEVPMVREEHRNWLAQAGVVIIDECFAKGTPIATPDGERPIETITVGDKVIAENGIRKVLKIYKNKVRLNKLAKVTLSNGVVFFCTRTHEFKTELGWVPVEDACGLALVELGFRSISKQVPNHKENHAPKKEPTHRKNLPDLQIPILGGIQTAESRVLLLPQMRGGFAEATNHHFIRLSILWETIRSPLRKATHTKILQPLLRLFRQLKHEGGSKKITKQNSQTNEKEQPHAQTWGSRKNEGDKTTKRNPTHLAGKTGWKWTTDGATDSIGQIPELADRIPNPYKNSKGARLPDMLQGRPCQSETKTGYRNRWEGPQLETKKRPGQKEGNKTKGTWVESVEVYQPGRSVSTFESVVGDQERLQEFIILHNLEVDIDHSYFANRVLVKNCHLFGDEFGQYATILRSTNAPIRIGFTATMPPEGTHIALALEGMVGPLIDQVTMEEGLEKGLLAMPKIELLPVKTNSKIAYLKVYKDIYQAGIVNNRSRNRLIISKAKAMNTEGKSVIIFVQEINHGYNLVDLAKLMDLPVEFVQGATEAEDREKIKDDIQEGHLMCVIASNVWREGVNIPNLGGVIIAGGGKTEMGTLQAIGRALRRVEGKDNAVIIDLLDKYRYLAELTIERITTYIQQGWM